MRNIAIMLSVMAISLLMVGASALWYVEDGGLPAAASLVIALCSFFFNVSGGAYLAEGMKLDDNVSRLPGKAGKVAVAIPTYNSDARRLIKCIKSIKGLEYPGEVEIFVPDDSTDGGIAREIAGICKKEGVRLMRRERAEGGKAGALNCLLEGTDAEFLAIFDADEIATGSGFFRETMGHFRKKGVAFVQTNKKCGGEGLFERAADYTNAAFVNLIQPINTRRGVGLFTGSCGIFRVGALKDAGGFPESLIEDIAVSLRLLWRGWKSEHVPRIYAVGGSVGSFKRFAKQHMRYICGITSLLPEYARNIWKFSFGQKAILVVHALGLHYVSMVQLAACAIAVYAAVSGSVYGELASIAYLVSSVSCLVFLSRAYSGSAMVGIFAYLLNFSVMVPRAIAGAGAVFGLRLIGGKAVAFSAGLQLVLGALLAYGSVIYGSVALLWWGALFLSNPCFLLIKR